MNSVRVCKLPAGPGRGALSSRPASGTHHAGSFSRPGGQGASLAPARRGPLGHLRLPRSLLCHLDLAFPINVPPGARRDCRWGCGGRGRPRRLSPMAGSAPARLWVRQPWRPPPRPPRLQSAGALCGGRCRSRRFLNIPEKQTNANKEAPFAPSAPPASGRVGLCAPPRGAGAVPSLGGRQRERQSQRDPEATRKAELHTDGDRQGLPGALTGTWASCMSPLRCSHR